MGFVTHMPLPDFGAQPSALDFGGLDGLKQGARSGQPSSQQQKAIARQFEAMFIQLLLKQARQSMDGFSNLFDSPASRMAQSLGDEQMALTMAEPGLGLADALMAQIQGHDAGGTHAESPVAEHSVAATDSGLPAAGNVVAESIDALIRQLSAAGIVGKVGRALQDAPAHIRDFVDRMGGAAQHAARQSGVPEKLILSQAALESGWGRREILRPDGSTSHNLFGIKAGDSWGGDVVHVMTTEYVDGVARKVSQPFRAYDSYEDSFADYANLIGNSARYKAVLQAPSAEAAARSIQAAGYATDPSYADKLISIMAYFGTK